VAFFDADEFLYFPNGDKVTDLIKRLPNKHIAINWVMFGSKEEPYQFNTIINRFLYRSATVNDHVKTIIRLHQGAKMTSSHHSNQSGYSPEMIQVTGSFNTRGSMENCFLAHYWTQDVDYWMRKIMRGRPDTGMDRNRTWKDFDNHNITCNTVYDDRLTKVEYER
jgi:hypothetical protein